MRLLTLIGLLVLPIAACRVGPSWQPATLQCLPDSGMGALAVSVVDDAGRPVRDAAVSPDWLDMAHSDSMGVACLSDVDPGTTVVHVSRLGFLADSATLPVTAGRVRLHQFTLHRAEPPCCRLGGTWEVRLDIERLNLQQPEPTSRSITGRFIFSERLPSWLPQREASDSLVRFENGHSVLDLTPFFGGPYAEDVSTTVFGGGATLLREIVGIVPSGDSVNMTLIPRMSHGGLSFKGRIAGDSIEGRWVQNAYCCGADGAFVMRRRESSAQDDSIVADALRTYERDRQAADSIARERAAARTREREQRPREEPRARISIRGNDGSDPGDRLVIGQRSRLVAREIAPAGRVLMKDIPGATIVWTTTDERVIAVDSSGHVVARTAGQAYARAHVRAIAPDARFADGVTDSIRITVVSDEQGLADRRFTAVAAASIGTTTCAIAGDVTPVCLHRVLGDTGEYDGTTSLAPLRLDDRPRALAAGTSFSCALLEDDSIACWGDNSDGQLATGDSASGPIPRRVVGDLRFRRIAAARTHACAVTVTDALYCWGMMLNGGLGSHAQDRCSLRIERLAAHMPQSEPTRCARRPVTLLEGRRVYDVAVGDDHTCAIASPRGQAGGSMELFCWGWIYNIELQSTTPVRMTMPDPPLVSLTSGSEHVCGLTTAGEAWCWGRNWLGQGGAATPGRAGSRQPLRVATDVRFRMLSAGGEHTCGIAVDGRAWCWGDNSDGQLGNGLVDRGGTAPVLVAGNLRFRSIAAGGAHTCAVSASGGLWCWGNGLAFRSGGGSYHEQPEPFPVAGWSEP